MTLAKRLSVFSCALIVGALALPLAGCNSGGATNDVGKELPPATAPGKTDRPIGHNLAKGGPTVPGQGGGSSKDASTGPQSVKK